MEEVAKKGVAPFCKHLLVYNLENLVTCSHLATRETGSIVVSRVGICVQLKTGVLGIWKKKKYVPVFLWLPWPCPSQEVVVKLWEVRHERAGNYLPKKHYTSNSNTYPSDSN